MLCALLATSCTKAKRPVFSRPPSRGSYRPPNWRSTVALISARPILAFFSRHLPTFQRALRKVLGALDYRRKAIYLDFSQQESRQRFIALHETGHGTLPWQRDLCLDDDETLSSDVKEEFEREANVFASEVLFQQEVFEEEASKLELTIKTPLALSRKFGASAQATARRYVERSPKRCAALVLDMKKVAVNGISVRNFFASLSFCNEFGELHWPDICPAEHVFVRGALCGKKMLFGQIICLPTRQRRGGFCLRCLRELVLRFHVSPPNR